MSVVRLDYLGSEYCFTRDTFGKGYWYCVRGKIPTIFGSATIGLVVPSLFAADLTKEAVARGIARQDDLMRSLAKKVREKKGNRKPRRSHVLVASFNPFDEPQTPEEEVIQQLRHKPKSRFEEEETTSLFSEIFEPEPDEPDDEEEDFNTFELIDVDSEE